MYKFERVLSDEEMAVVINNGCTSDLFSLAERVEKAVLAKLAEQEPVMYARTYYGEIDWDEACVTEKNDGALMHATDMRREDFVKHGYEIIPLYAHPCVSTVSDKTVCVSPSALSDTQAENSPTKGMNLGERIAHVGGRENKDGYVEFGSVMAVHALISHVIRDLGGNCQGILDSSKTITKENLPPLPEPHCRHGGGIGYFDSYSKEQMIEYAKSAIDHYKAMLAAAPKYTEK